MALDVYKAVTNRLIELLDQGMIPWHHSIRDHWSDLGLPTNLATQRTFRGINVFLLAATARTEGYMSPYWLTFLQAKKKGGYIRKGEKGTLVALWKQHNTHNRASGKEITVPALRHYMVFNSEQCDGIELPTNTFDPTPRDRTITPIEAAEAIVGSYANGPKIEHRNDRALYQPSKDVVCVPDLGRCVDRESYYTILFRELIHSTGHSSRLGWGLNEESPRIESPEFTKVTLMTDMGVAFLAAASGISTAPTGHTSVQIHSWQELLRSDRKLAVHAAGFAQRAADWILGKPASPG